MERQRGERATHKLYMRWFEEHVTPTKWWQDKQAKFECFLDSIQQDLVTYYNMAFNGCPPGCLNLFRTERYPSVFHGLLDRVRKHVDGSKHGADNIKLVSYRLGACATNERDKGGYTAIHLACFRSVCLLETLTCLWKRAKLDIHARTIRGETLLLVTARNGMNDHIEFLLEECSAEIGARDKEGNTALHLTVFNKRESSSALLIAKGSVDIATKNNESNTPLHLACSVSQSSPMFDTYFKYAAKRELEGINMRNINGDTALHLAVNTEDNPWNESCVLGLLDRGAKTDLKNIDGNTPLHVATILNNRKLVKHLIDKGADTLLENKVRSVRCRVPNNVVQTWVSSLQDGNTALHMATLCTCTTSRTLTETLLDGGADINARGEDGKTPLHIACTQGCVELCTLLLDKRADVNAKNDDGDTALHQSARADRLDLCKLLVERGADLKARNKNGQTPWSLVRTLEYMPSELEEFMTQCYRHSEDSLSVNLLLSDNESKPKASPIKWHNKRMKRED